METTETASEMLRRHGVEIQADDHASPVDIVRRMASLGIVSDAEFKLFAANHRINMEPSNDES